MSSPSPSTDRNLIFGLLALQMDFLTSEQLLDAMNAWMLRKTTPVGDIQRERGLLNERRLELLQGMVEEHKVPATPLLARRACRQCSRRTGLDRLIKQRPRKGIVVGPAHHPMRPRFLASMYVPSRSIGKQPRPRTASGSVGSG